MRWNRSSKYHAVKVNTLDGIFDSKHEYMRWLELKKLQADGEILDLQRQVEYELIPEHRAPDRRGPRGGLLKGKIIEKKCVYVADFVYREALPFYGKIEDLPLCVEDAKGFKTPEYVIKRKLMLDRYGIRVKEV